MSIPARLGRRNVLMPAVRDLAMILAYDLLHLSYKHSLRINLYTLTILQSETLRLFHDFGGIRYVNQRNLPERD